jgi:NodT family efflux transporter outer membrane factor (OMF) lipoprotein
MNTSLFLPRSDTPRSALHAPTLHALALTLLCGCNFAPKYTRPPIETPANFKEQSAAATNIWKKAQPSDDTRRGKWWEAFGDPRLASLEDQVTVSNQTVAAAFANFLSARAQVTEARAQLFPTVAANPSFVRSRQSASGNRSGSSTSTGTNFSVGTFSGYSLPLDASWQLDLWGRIRNTVKAAATEAQATASDLENTRLTVQAELAADYFQLRAQDALIQHDKETVADYRESVNLAQVRFQTGIASDQDVTQAETQLKTVQAQGTGLGVLRAQLEHAMAVLLGKPPSSFSESVETFTNMPPIIPAAIPSELLERRPDIAAAERRVAEANARIGIARAAYFPSITLSGSTGFQSSAIDALVDWPSRFWSIGAQMAETVFDAGLRRATVQQFRAAYEGAVAQYRQTVLTAFQQVEDNLAAVRILEQQTQEEQAAVEAAERYLALAKDRYKLGIDSYLNVITAETTLLSNRQTLVNIRYQQLAAAVHLIQALGGGWR